MLIQGNTRQKHVKNACGYQYSSDSVVQVRTFINFLTSEFGSSTRGERETQFLKVFRIILCWQNSNTRHISWSFRSPFLFAGRDPKNLTVCLNGQNQNFSTPWSELNFYCPSTWPKSTTNSTGPHSITNWTGPHSTTNSSGPQPRPNSTCLQPRPKWRLSQNTQILSPSLPGMRSFTLQSHFLSEVYYQQDQLWLSYLLRTSVNCNQCLCTWTKSRIVQSLTKLNNKIKLTKNDLYKKKIIP